MTTNNDEDNKSLSQICEEYLASLTPSFKYNLKAGLKVLETVVSGFPLEWLYSHNAEDIQKFLRKARDTKGSPFKKNTQRVYADALSKLQGYLKAHYQHEPPTSQVKQPQSETSHPISTPKEPSKPADDEYTVPLAETELTDQLQEWELEGIFKVEWCNYGTIIKEGERLYKIHCSSPKETQKKWLPKDRLLTPTVCRNCGLRKEGARSSKTRLQLNDRQEIYCKQEGMTKQIKYCKKWCPPKCEAYRKLIGEEQLDSETTSKEPHPSEPSTLPKTMSKEHLERLVSQKAPLTYAQKLIARGLMNQQERQRFIEAEILRKKEELSLKEKKRYAITHQLYETNCHSCSHLLGYYSDSEKKFGTVECDAETCGKR